MESSLFTRFLLFSCIVCPVFSLLGPLHASCKVEWTMTPLKHGGARAKRRDLEPDLNFSADCTSIKNRLVTIINEWASPDNCKNGGERCLYKLKKETDTEITATHETPVKHYVDDLTFNFEKPSDNMCTVKGYSTSETWYALLDQGTNYCNLHNLITGAALDKVAGYKEATSNSVCTQYSSANCDKY